MNIEILKNYIQNYLNAVIIPQINKQLENSEYGKIEFRLYDVLKGSYQPPIYHLFIDVEPHDILKKDLKKTENEITDFLRIFQIYNTKIHWNKRPIFKDSKKYESNN